MIFTSYWSSKKVGDGMVKVAISRGVPPGWEGPREWRLAPASWAMLKLPKDAFAAAFAAQLAALDADTLYSDLIRVCVDCTPVLCCWEKPVENCHRRFVIPWLRQAGPVEELA